MEENKTVGSKESKKAINNDILAKAKDYFSRCKNTNEVWVSDGNLYKTKGAALSHGNGEVQCITRAQADKYKPTKKA